MYIIFTYTYTNIYTYRYTYTYIQYFLPFQMKNGKTKTQAFFLNPCTASSSYKRKFVACPFVDDQTNGNNRFQMD